MVEFAVSSAALTDIEADALVIPLFEGEGLSPGVRVLNELLENRIQIALDSGEARGEFGEMTVFHGGPNLKVRFVIAAGAGKTDDFSRITLLRMAASIGRKLQALRIRHAILGVNPKRIKGLTALDRAPLLAQGMLTGPYDPGFYKSANSNSPRVALEKVTFAPVKNDQRRAFLKAANEGAVVGENVNRCRDFVNEPSNVLHPTEFARRIAAMAEERGVECEVLEPKQIASLNMNAFLSVAQGSAQPPRLVILRYHGTRRGQTLGLVGKGVTFDTGGISIKPSAKMEEMKGDMAGAASVVAATLAAAELKLPVNLITMTPLTENMPGGTATRPGDIVKARNGKTIEIINTDAEGRLIMSDVLTYISEQKVDRVVDVATLTGGMVVALGTQAAGFMTPDHALARDIEKAADRAGERLWRMPLFPEYRELLDSTFADMKNVGGRDASPLTAGMFLAEFVGEQPWAHIDIAGPAYQPDGKDWRPAGASGEPVRTLVELIRGMAKS